MARRQYYRRRIFLIFALLSLYISLNPFLISARTETSKEFETKGQELNQIIHLRSIETDLNRRTRTRRMMNVEEINDYPGSGANNRHTPKPYCPDC
ncbi:hypothetical protein AALP_AA2G185900 [Arabis alpina]|uniref:Uncharacterized protein n=1 Tax=Arabis alpina TaxID=50452 RepID=A0A087HIE1_ARAAL|nr:hypothetical protein AALP_AA2G185900 [Arabis alpina]